MEKWHLEIAKWQRLFCKVDEERLTNLDLIVEGVHYLIDCKFEHAQKKLIADGRDLPIGEV